MEGWVSLSWMATLSGKLSKDVRTGSRQPNLADLKRRIMSCSDAATIKYSCFNRSSFPEKKLSLGYKTREMLAQKRTICTICTIVSLAVESIQQTHILFSVVPVEDGLNVVAVVEELEAKVVRTLGRPQTKSVDRIVQVSRHRHIVLACREMNSKQVTSSISNTSFHKSLGYLTGNRHLPAWQRPPKT